MEVQCNHAITENACKIRNVNQAKTHAWFSLLKKFKHSSERVEEKHLPGQCDPLIDTLAKCRN